jgi:hypothetical protein
MLHHSYLQFPGRAFEFLEQACSHCTCPVPFEHAYNVLVIAAARRALLRLAAAVAAHVPRESSSNAPPHDFCYDEANYSEE